MFDPFSHEDHDLSEAIASALADLKSFNADDEGYEKTVNQLTKLYAIKHDADQLNLQAQKDHASHQLECDKNTWQEEQDQRPFYMRVDPNTLLTVAGNAFVALAVIKYEQRGVIASKVMTFMKKI